MQFGWNYQKKEKENIPLIHFIIEFESREKEGAILIIHPARKY